MTELQMGLIGLGSAAVVGVLAYNKWQEHKHRKVAEQVLRSHHADVLLDKGGAPEEAPPVFEPAAQQAMQYAPDPRQQGRVEPALYDPVESESESESEPAPELAAWAAPAMAAESVPERAPAAEPAPAKPSAPPLRRAEEASAAMTPSPCLVAAAIDYVATFEAVEPLPGHQLRRSQREPLERIAKPIGWAGYNERIREWERIADDSEEEYRRLRVGLQLADRRGPAADADLAVFHLAMQALADEMMAVADLPPRQPALDAARQLDQFCANVDIQIGINVVAQGQTFPGTKIRALAEAAGMVIDVDGRFMRCDDDGRVLYTLGNNEGVPFTAEAMKTLATHGLTFLLDVPRVDHGERVFAQMLELARRFADALHGSVVDDNRRPLTEAMLEPIRRQIAQYQAAMAARGVHAGGPLALRLFV